MARQGLQRGFNQAYLQGVKSGHAMGNHRTGYAGGITDGTANMDKLQDPVVLTGNKKPLIYCNADNITTNTGTVITLTDLIKSGFTLTNAQGSGFTPDLLEKNIWNLRNALDFNDSRCSLYPTPTLNFSGDSEVSVMMVLKLKPIYLLYQINAISCVLYNNQSFLVVLPDLDILLNNLRRLL